MVSLVTFPMRQWTKLGGSSEGAKLGPHLRKITGTMKLMECWINYHDLTATAPEIMVNMGHHPQMALIQVREL